MISFKSKRAQDRSCQDNIEVIRHTTSSGSSLPFPLSHSSFSSPPSTFLVFSPCCFVPLPVAVRTEVPNTSTSPLKTYPPCGFTRLSLSALPVSPSNPPVITVVTYGSATPSPFTKRVFLSECERQRFLFFQTVSICVRIYVNAHLVGLVAYIIAQLYSWYLLILLWPCEWPCAHIVCEVSDV